MKVSIILQKKGSNNVATIEPNAKVSDAVKAMAEHRIGALVVSEGDGRVSGIISERDVVGQMGTEGAGVLGTRIAEVMTAEVKCCVAEDTALDVLARMTDGRFRHMPVLDTDHRMIGILSIGDVVKARLEEIEAENAAMADMLSS